MVYLLEKYKMNYEDQIKYTLQTLMFFPLKLEKIICCFEEISDYTDYYIIPYSIKDYVV